jgi:neural Wiskott-Aldrich syndrome protein
VHTRRFSPHALALAPAPRTRSLVHPTPVDAQLPRTTFAAGERIPVYVTVPPPARELVLERGVRLRHVRVELVRVVRVRGADTEHPDPDGESSSESSDEDYHPLVGDVKIRAGGAPTPARAFAGRAETTVIAKSGAACRFHASRAVRQRFVLHPPAPSDPDAHGDAQEDAAAAASTSAPPADDDRCAAISQTTLLHAVSFRVLVHVAFLEAPTRTARTLSLALPVTLLPPEAPLPEVEPAVDAAYRKKHDRPPARTVRRTDTELAGPADAAAGPSGAPPPFEEREAPPPFFSVAAPPPAAAESSSAARLPTFLESETDAYVAPPPPPRADALAFPGEGVLFGFAPADQFDGHDEGGDEEDTRAAGPPPTLEQARGDADVTELAALAQQPQLALEALGRVLEQQRLGEDGQAGAGGDAGEAGPPPPPPMDDPSDPPPSIDSEFRTHGGEVGSPRMAPDALGAAAHAAYVAPPAEDAHAHTHAGEPLLPPPPPPPPHADDAQAPAAGNAPPPYLIPEGEHEHAPGPPPYVG